ncbi:hypothetical protein E2C01_079393 [Portunus trituberculatus]|uniref:Uncharacterized protein n=1 Tax=Portunus trituberculatus TaxID=210409 RepID=A0A5B7IVI1_PORTR|nr:hypothetical protein [Portunus trituberculatus]
MAILLPLFIHVSPLYLLYEFSILPSRYLSLLSLCLFSFRSPITFFFSLSVCHFCPNKSLSFPLSLPPSRHFPPVSRRPDVPLNNAHHCAVGFCIHTCFLAAFYHIPSFICFVYLPYDAMECV